MMNTTNFLPECSGKKAVIMGATSGIGYEVACLLLKDGWQLGLAGRRTDRLKSLQQQAPDRIVVRRIDVQEEDAGQELKSLIDEIGGMDLYLHSTGIGYQNYALDAETEINTLKTNGTGFVRMVTTAYHHFRQQGKGHLAIISSIAGTKGLGIAPAYSASKRFQNLYIDALEQLAHMENLHICFTDIRPGFVATDLLNNGKHYPMLMKTGYVAACIVQALQKQKRTVIIDWRYRLLVGLWQIIPHWLWKCLPVKN